MVTMTVEDVPSNVAERFWWGIKRALGWRPPVRTLQETLRVGPTIAFDEGGLGAGSATLAYG